MQVCVLSALLVPPKSCQQSLPFAPGKFPRPGTSWKLVKESRGVYQAEATQEQSREGNGRHKLFSPAIFPQPRFRRSCCVYCFSGMARTAATGYPWGAGSRSTNRTPLPCFRGPWFLVIFVTSIPSCVTAGGTV